jgi:predicted metalloprotease with PDZ domain
MLRRFPTAALLVCAALTLAADAFAEAPVEYRLAFPDYVHHVMDVEVTFREVTADPLEIRMSRTSPGRYALHEFAKNVFDVRVTGAGDRSLAPEQPNLHQWNVRGHGGTVRVRYRVFGDRIDGTYFGLDTTLANLNIPATLMWARGLETRPAQVALTQPPGESWTVATQLYPTADPLVFTAPNLQYLMDSPIKFSPHVVRTFTVARAAGAPPATIRLALDHDGGQAEADAFAADLEKIVREQQAVFGELPEFDSGTYTFLATYRAGANGDGMEHRNSTVVTSSGGLGRSPAGQLGTASHEFFHAWNVERIRPRSLEPFNFEEANVSGELWLAEGVTSYYGPLTLARAGLASLDTTLRQFAGNINAVSQAPGHRFRSAVDMSRLAPFVDNACAVDVTNWDDTFLSYYTFGAALGLGLDLSLRDLTNGRVSMDDYMRALWERHGRTKAAPGLVATPYTLADAQAVLAAVSGNPSFAEEFFRRYVLGYEVVDYGRLLARAGFVLRPRQAGRAWMGDLPLGTAKEGVVVSGSSRMGTPAYTAGLGEGDVIQTLDGAAVKSADDIAKIVGAKTPGTRLAATVLRRGRARTIEIALAADPGQELVTIEQSGGTLTPEQRQFRDAWLRSRAY